MSARSIPAGRIWNTWDPVYPAELVHHASGTHVALAAYSDATGTFTRFPPGHRNGVTLGPRSIDAGNISLDLEHAGTKIAVDITRDDDDVLKFHWRTEAFGEWGLRFWLMICLWRDEHSHGDHAWSYDPDSTEMSIWTGDGDVVVRGPRFPLMATFHDTLAHLKQEYEEKGYFYLASRGTSGPIGVLRYNLEEMAEFQVALTWAPTAKEASAKVQHALAAPSPPAIPRLHDGQYAGALDAVRDCVAWNTVWDRHNQRPYTSLSRNWVAQKFGGWGVWLNDVVYHGLMGGLFDADLGHENQNAVFDGVTEAGNLPCLLTGNDAWVDRSQPPVVGFTTWCHYLRTGDRRFLEDAWPVLKSNHDWWWRMRDGNRNGLLEFGTSPVGTGLYRGTKLAAKDESMMDNSPIHDEARLMEEVHTLDCEDVGLNSFVALDGEILAHVARALGHLDEADKIDRQTNALKARIRDQLWDDARGVFANRLWSGKFTDSIAPTSFFPLVCGAATAEQAEAMVENWLKNPDAFYGEHMLPAVTRNDPAFGDNVYWRGRIWPPLNFLTYYGLRRYGLDDAASLVADSSYRIFMANWERARICGENFNGTTGQADDQPDTDLFYTWGALMAYVAAAELSDINPWQGWTVTRRPGETFRLGPLLTPAGEAVITAEGEMLTVEADNGLALKTNITGRLAHLWPTPERCATVIPPSDAECWLEVTIDGRTKAAQATLDGKPLAYDAATGRVVLPASDAPQRLDITFDKA
jgi:putative isomerase